MGQIPKQKITVAYGDGIGPEIMDATLKILEAAGAAIEPEVIEIGEKVYTSGYTAGIKPEAWDSIRNTKVFLKAPITTPQGGGYKSLNVTIRKTLGLFANVRPCLSLHPWVNTRHPELDVVVVRENEEDLYAGIEHQQTAEVVQCLKLISRPGCERIVRYAFEYARANGRKKVTCLVKDNIMKHTDGLFHSVFDEIAAEYPEIEKEAHIIDIGTAWLADNPERFDVVVTLNLYGDIISDVVAQIAGSVGMAGSANVGQSSAMFEAIHGSAPDIAGQNIANPSGLINGAVMMLVHIGQSAVAAKIANAWLTTIEDGIHTGDIFQEGVSKKKVGSAEFAQAVIDRLGREPVELEKVSFGESKPIELPLYQRREYNKQLVGVDVFVDAVDITPDGLGAKLSDIAGEKMRLKLITNRGVKVFPDGQPETFCTDHWRCRFVSSDSDIREGSRNYKPIDYQQVVELLGVLYSNQVDVIKTENLFLFDGERGFSLGQGE